MAEHPYSELFFNGKKSWAMQLCKIIEETKIHIAQWKEVSMKRLHFVWFQLNDILKKVNIMPMIKKSVLSGIQRE
jgi:hypothetical protein